MNFSPKFLGNIALGFLLGSISMLALAWTLDGQAGDELKRFQIFVYGALVSVFAASLALAGVLTNLDLQSKMNAQARERKADSARAFLPAALSSLGASARTGLHHRFTISIVGTIMGVNQSKNPRDLEISDEVIQVFRDLLEHSENTALREHLFEILREHQVLVARSNSPTSGNFTQPTSDDYAHVAHWGYLITLIGILFDYARGEANTITNEVTDNNIQSSLHVSGIVMSEESIGNYANHFKLYAKRYDRRLGSKTPS